METINDIEDSLLVEAMSIWTGWGHERIPGRHDEFLVDHFGAKIAAKVLPVLESLKRDFYSTDARFVADSLQEMGERASEQFRKKHPAIVEEIVTALEWCYTFDNKFEAITWRKPPT